jgi:hypothetical protein
MDFVSVHAGRGRWPPASWHVTAHTPVERSKLTSGPIEAASKMTSTVPSP